MTLNLTCYGRYAKTTTDTSIKIEINLFWTAMIPCAWPINTMTYKSSSLQVKQEPSRTQASLNNGEQRFSAYGIRPLQRHLSKRA